MSVLLSPLPGASDGCLSPSCHEGHTLRCFLRRRKEDFSGKPLFCSCQRARCACTAEKDYIMLSCECKLYFRAGIETDQFVGTTARESRDTRLLIYHTLRRGGGKMIARGTRRCVWLPPKKSARECVDFLIRQCLQAFADRSVVIGFLRIRHLHAVGSFSQQLLLTRREELGEPELQF